MGDHFEQAMTDIAKRRNGGGKTIDDLFDLVVAGNRDAEERHDESVCAIAQNRQVLLDHCIEANLRDERLDGLEKWRHEQATTCERRVIDLIQREHAERHTQYVATLGDAAFQSRLVWFFATAAGKVVLVVIGLAAGILLNFAVYGRP